MARTHATSGAVAYLGAVCVAGLAGFPVDPLMAGVGAVAAAGGAMLPDLDHPSALVSNSVGILSKSFSRLVAAVSGGHREGTHSAVGLAVFGVLAFGADLAGGWLLGVWLAFLCAIAVASVRMRVRKRFWLHTILCVAGGVVLFTTSLAHDSPTGLLTAAVVVGYAAHIVGDMLTVEGCPLLWPVKHRYRLASLRTDGIMERYIIGSALSVAAAGLMVAVAFL